MAERGTLDTNFYLTYSLLRRGYPHRDVHMPGYVLALAPFVAGWGATLRAAATLNVAAFAACAVLVHVLARGLLPDPRSALAAGILFAVLPPFPGYLFVAYPELVVTLAFLAGLAWLVHARGTAGAAVAGLLFALGALFRETLLLALPVYAGRLERRAFWRGFVPAAAATLAFVVAPLSRHRAVHPNALYPSVVEEALASGSPVRTLAGAVARNVSTNLGLTAGFDPAGRAEDAMLLFLAALMAAAIAGHPRDLPGVRSFARGAFVSIGLLTVAVLALYVVRERGGVWGGVRAYMCWAPVLLVLATPMLARRRAWKAAVAAGALAAAFLWLDLWQVRFFNRYKGTDLEDQERNAAYLSRWIDDANPHRIVSRSFLYGLTHYPVEVVWSLPRDGPELLALNQAIGYEFLVIHEKSALRPVLVGNPRFLRVNKDDRGAEFLVWRRLY